MRIFGSIYSTLWKSKKFNSILSNETKLFYIYAHTCQHGNSIGCYYLPIHYAAGDLRLSETVINNAIDECAKALLIDYDFGEEIIRIRDFLMFNTIDNPKHATGAVRHTIALPDVDFKTEALNELEKQKHVNNNPDLVEMINSELNNMLIRNPY